MGIDNGRQDDHTSYQANSRNAFAGKVLAIVQSTKKAGKFHSKQPVQKVWKLLQ